MKIYLTGVDSIKAPKRKYNQEEAKKITKKQNYFQEKKENIKEESHPQNLNENKEKTKISKKSKRNTKSININANDEIKKKNNFISSDDIRKNNTNNKNKIFTKKIFDNVISSKNKKGEEKKSSDIITAQLKEDFLDFLIEKEPKYADFDKITEELQERVYNNYRIYNTNIIEIKKKKKVLKNIVNQIEKSLINNYYVTNNTLIPKKVELIEKTKIDILTKQQEYEGYQNIFNDLYNQNYLIKREVLDEIDIDTANEDFHDQYKSLEIHAIAQVSKKQESLNQTEEYYKKLLKEHEKEYKAKNKILRELKIEIEVFKEDEKELIHKLRKLKAKRNEIKLQIKEKKRKNLLYHENLIKNSKRWQKSFISMNKVFKSVNASNLDDVLLDVNSINHRFNTLKNLIMSCNQEITNLNEEYSKKKEELKRIKKEIKLNKNKEEEIFSQREQDKIFKIKALFKNEKDEQNLIREEIQKQIGVFQNGIIFLFHKIKALVINIKILKNVLSPRMLKIIHKYKHQAYRLNYDQINKKFFKQFAFLFFQYCNAVFYLSLRTMCSGLTAQEKKKKNETLMVQINKKKYLNILKDKIKKSLKDYKHRSELKIQKQKEIKEQEKQKELQKKLNAQLIQENKLMNKKQMFKKFLEYLREKEEKKNSSKSKAFNGITKRNENIKKNSFFFTGIDSVKYTISNFLESSKSSSSSSNSHEKENITINSEFNKKKEKYIIPYEQKEEFLDINKNKLINLFSKYENNLVKDEGQYLYEKKKIKSMKKSRSDLSPKLLSNFQFESQQFNPYFSFRTKNKNKKEEEFTNLNKDKFINLFDENYIFDEDDAKNDKNIYGIDKRKKKDNKIFNFNTFLKINKDRANIYKKKSDLHKLQMAYFGGRLLNTKINPDLTTGTDNIDDMFGRFSRKQEKGKYKYKKKLRIQNYKRKSVYHISANKSMKDKVSLPWKSINKERLRKCYSSNNRTSKNPNYLSIKSKYMDYSKKNTLSKTKTERFEKISFPPFTNTYNKLTLCSPYNLYRPGIE